MLGMPRILSLFPPTRLKNSINHEHSYKILYLTYKRAAKATKSLCKHKDSLDHSFYLTNRRTFHIIIIEFFINAQVQGHHPHQWALFQVTS